MTGNQNDHDINWMESSSLGLKVIVYCSTMGGVCVSAWVWFKFGSTLNSKYDYGVLGG